MTKKAGRLDFLTEMLGNKKKTEIEEGAEKFAALLEGAGINRKAKSETKLKGILEDVQPQIVAVLDVLTDDADLKARVANEAIAVLMGAFASEPAEAVEEIEDVEEPLPDEAVEIMADEDEAVIDEEDDEETVAELSKQVTAMAAENATMYKMMNEFIPAMIDMAKTVKALTPLVKQVPDIVTLKAQMAELEKVTKMAPRIASQDNGSILQKSDDKSTQLKLDGIASEIKKGTEGVKTELGIRVKG